MAADDDKPDTNESYKELWQHFDDITRLVSDLIWDVDQDLVICNVSARLRELTGYLPHEWVGSKLEDVGTFINSDGTKTDWKWRKPFRDQLFVVLGRDGEKYTFLLSGTPYYHVISGKLEGVRGVARDITQTLLAEEELRHSKEVAEKSNHAKTDFLASMSHELRTPLNGILGFAQLLELNRKEPLSTSQKEYTKLIIGSGEHLLELIDQVLELAKIEAGRYVMDITDVDILGLLDECLSIIKTTAAKREITVHRAVTSCDVMIVRADETRLMQVMLNVLSNAVKYNHAQGSVSVSVEATDDDRVRISITDTGLGIAADKQSGLFEPFERLGHENSEIEGTGIGLTITRELLLSMDGSISAQSVEGQGSTFMIDLPISKTQKDSVNDTVGVQTEEQSGDEMVQKLTGTYSILYVEDNPANMALMEHILDMVPEYEMIAAHNAEIGIAIAEERCPDLILMDINLPGMDGIAAMKQLGGMEATKHIPVVAITANAMPKDIEDGIRAGFRAYLTKPFQVDRLFATLKEIFNETNPQHDAQSANE